MEITTPVGRIVWGQNPLKPKPVIDDATKLPKLDKTGKPRMQISFGLAIPKAEFQATVWPALYNVAAQAFNGSVPPSFAYKYVDGDGVDPNGQPYANRPGYAGCYILTVSTEVDNVPMFQFDGTHQCYNQIPSDALKCGDYVSCGVDIVYNGQKSPNKPGVYVNPKAVDFVGYGEHIASQGGADPNAMFGRRQHQLPHGASATPVGGSSIGMPGMGMQQPAMQGQPMMAQPQPAMQGQPMMAQPQPAMQGQPMMAPPQPAMQGQPMMAPPQPAMQGQPMMAPPQPAMQGQPMMAPPQPAMQGQPMMAPPQPAMPAPAHDFVQNALGVPQGQPMQGGMPGMMPPR